MKGRWKCFFVEGWGFFLGYYFLYSICSILDNNVCSMCSSSWYLVVFGFCVECLFWIVFWKSMGLVSDWDVVNMVIFVIIFEKSVL